VPQANNYIFWHMVILYKLNHYVATVTTGYMMPS